MDKFQKRALLGIAFSLGWLGLLGNALSFILIPLIALNLFNNRKSCIPNNRQEQLFLALPLLFCLYMLLHFLIQHFVFNNQAQASFSIFERLLLFFFTIPLYILSVRPYMTQELLKETLSAFCWGILLFNFSLFFLQTGTSLFTHPVDTINNMYLTRLGNNKENILGGITLMLEPQSMTLALAAFSALFIFIKKRNITTFFLTSLLILFLSFTLTKSAIIAFIVSCIFTTLFLFRKKPSRTQLLCWISSLLISLFVLFSIEGIQQRIDETTTEILNIAKGELDGGSIGPRLILWKYALNHLNEFALFGEGLYDGYAIDQWYSTLPDSVIHRANTHNSFLQFWIKGGIFGLFLLLSFFIFPMIRMLSLKKWSLLILGGLTILFITNNTCVLFIHGNSLGIILFWLSMYYFYAREFILLEENK